MHVFKVRKFKMGEFNFKRLHKFLSTGFFIYLQESLANPSRAAGIRRGLISDIDVPPPLPLPHSS